MEQFLTLDIGSNKATLDLSRIRKQGLIHEKNVFGRKPKIVIYYDDRPETPEVNVELNSNDEAEEIYNSIVKKLNRWAESSNSAKLKVMEQELEVMHQQKDALIEETKILKEVFEQFKEMMQIVDTDKKTEDLLRALEEA